MKGKEQGRSRVVTGAVAADVDISCNSGQIWLEKSEEKN